MIKLGTSDMAKAYIGSDEVSKIYLGSDLVYSAGLAPLPYDAEVEYIQTNGTPYINLGRKGNAATDALYIDFQVTTSVNQARLIASNNNNSPCQIYQNGSGGYGYRRQSTWGAISDVGTIGTDRHTWLCDYKNLVNTIDGVDYAMPSASTGTTNSNMYLCGPYTTNPRFVGKIYACKIYRNDILQLDLIPVRVEQVGYMYDRVNGTLFGNAASSGAFTIGSDV